MKIKTEALAYWYLRLNGFLTTVNFLIHPEARADSSTDVDILGVRFPYRCENLTRPMADEEVFSRRADLPYLVIAEVKSGACRLNGPWTDRTSRNMLKVLNAIGTFPPDVVPSVATCLLEHGRFTDQHCAVSLMCLGRSINPDLKARYPEVPQITWEQALRFIWARFRGYRREKAQHQQWNQDGKDLWACAARCRSADEFFAAVHVVPEVADARHEP